MYKKLKRKIKLQGRIKCHGNKTNCKREHMETILFLKKTPKGTKPIKKPKKVYDKKSISNN